MFSFTLSVIVIPIALVIAGLTLVRQRGDPGTVERRTFLFLVWTAIGITALVLVYWMFPHPGLGVLLVFVPILPAIVVLALLRFQGWHALRRQARVSLFSIILLLVILTVVQFWSGATPDGGGQLEAVFLTMALVSVTVFLFVTWTWGNRSPVLTGVLAVFYLIIFNFIEAGSLSLLSESLPGWLSFMGALAYLAVPGFTLSAAAALISSALHAIPGKSGTGFSSWRPFIGNLLLVLLLLGGLTYTFIWLWMWDGMDDGIRGLVILLVSGMVSFSAGMIITVTSSGLKRWVGFVFPVLVLILLSQVGISLGNRLSNYTVTEQRALRIQQAIENHRAATGVYPASLDELVPDEFWRIPLPMIIPNRDWCYESGPNHYRLGLVYREHWSSPYLDLRVYASGGNVPETTWICDEELAELRSLNDAIFNTPPTPVPLPTSVTSIERMRIEPFFKESSFSVGGWSPDGAYLVFGSTEYFMEDEVEHVTIDLRFLDARTGDICQPEPGKWTVQKSNGLRDHHAWLPDGRFLYVTDEGEMAAFEPCTGGMEDLADRFPVPFTHAVSFEGESGRVLLKARDGYWLLDGSRLEAQPIDDIPVDSTEVSWAWYAWSLGGERLAMSMLLGPEGRDGGFLYIVDGESGELMQSLPLPGASDAYLPVAEWLTRDDLLIHGKSLTVLDLRSDPPARTDLLRDVFLLDMEYPLDVSSVDSMPAPAGGVYFIGLRANHPNNQGLYLYNSSSGQVTVFDHNIHSLFFTGDGRCLRLSKWEDDPTYRDEYEMVWMDRPTEEHLLVVEGHVPRSHPQLFPRCLPRTSRLVFSSSQGVSLVALPEGRTVGFWELAGGAVWNDVFASPSEEALVIAADGDGLYYVPLPPE